MSGLEKLHSWFSSFFPLCVSSNIVYVSSNYTFSWLRMLIAWSVHLFSLLFMGPSGTILFHPGCTLITFMPRLSPPGSKSWSTFTSQHGNYRLSLLALSYLLCYPIISPYVSLSLFMFGWQKHIFSLRIFSPSSWMSGKDQLQSVLFHLQYVHTLF